MKRVGIDLLPLKPGGANGGAKFVALELIRTLSQVSPEREFVLLVSSHNACEVESLRFNNSNIRIEVIRRESARRWWPRFGLNGRSGDLGMLNLDVLFCPFVGVSFDDPGIPVVTLVPDLLFQYYPQFFSARDLDERKRDFARVCQLSSRLVTVSEFGRESLEQHSGFTNGKIHLIPHLLSDRLPSPIESDRDNRLGAYSVVPDRYLLYPANLWAHKNHQMLLTAFNRFVRAKLDSDLKLVCTGENSSQLELLQAAVRQMELEGRVIFTGFVSDGDLGALIGGCRALIFPSLFEGFGLPVLEAMSVGKPVLCSNQTSLPEVAGGAALMFDPRIPSEIVHCIERIDSDLELVDELSRKGREQSRKFSDANAMAERYLQVFEEASPERSAHNDGVMGVFDDGWCSPRVSVRVEPSRLQRTFELVVSLPESVPFERLEIRFIRKGHLFWRKQQLKRGERGRIAWNMGRRGGVVLLKFDSHFVPREIGESEDNRCLACICEGCRIVTGNRSIDLFPMR